MNLRNLKIADFNYPLPEERIALYPLAERDASKLLVYQSNTGFSPYSERTKVRSTLFRNIGEYLPQNSLLIFNDTKVVRARLVFHKGFGGARIEIFVLEPVEPADIALAFSSGERVVFKCLIGNNKKWKEGPLEMDFEGGTLQARRKEETDGAFLVEFSWNPARLSFAEVLEAAGRVPLPPYIRREAEDSDTLRYQTVFAKHDGSVAAPTAGLHFTESVLEELQRRGIRRNFVTLHVGAGTFKPVKSEEIGGHLMHREHITATRGLIEDLSEALRSNRPIIPVGTTSMRTLESLYWVGVRLLFCGSLRSPLMERTEVRSTFSERTKVRSTFGDGDRKSSTDFSTYKVVRASARTIEINQWDPYEDYAEAARNITPEQALQAILQYMDENGTDRIQARTALMIAPGYEFAFCRGLITNFHQPQSTLLLLVSALIGPVWREIYNYALQNGFRFLSYGDSCLFLPRS